MEEIEIIHKPVMLKEVLYYLNLKRGETVIDATIGLGGHSVEILKAIGNEGLLIGIDRDKEVLEIAKNRLEKININFVLFNTSYDKIPEILEELKITKVDKMLFDLGFSSFHIEKSGRGFSFRRLEEPLDMRYSLNIDITAAEILNTYEEKELENIFLIYGEEPYARKLAKKIVEMRRIKKFKYVKDLVEVIEKTIPTKTKKHKATKVFQALRIAVNDELNILQRALDNSIYFLSPKGRIAILTYHSLEDRIVKNFFKSNSKILIPINKKVITPSIEEIKNNPRSRSAKLRVGERRDVN